MLVPSTFVLFVGAFAVALLIAADWYVWGLNMTTSPRETRRPQPLTGIELVDLALGRLIAANEATLPKAAFATARAKGARLATDPDDGFKRVA
jgi:hypothetical protein